MAEIDVAFKVFADLKDTVDNIDKRMRRGEPKPIRKPVGGSAQTIVSGFGDYALVLVEESPAIGRVWDLRSVHAWAGPAASAAELAESASGAFTVGQFQQGFTAVVAAAAAGSLTVSASYVTGFRIDPAAAWPAGTNQVTITNLNGGTQTYDLPGGTSNPLIVNYPQPVPAPFGVPVISVPAITGGPAYTINATGTELGNGVINSAVDIFYGQPPLTAVPGSPFGPDLYAAIRTNLGPLPVHIEFPRRTYAIKPEQQLWAEFRQIPSAGTSCVLLATVEEWNVEDFEAMSTNG